MKSILFTLLAVLVFSNSALATSRYIGAYLSKTTGDLKRDPTTWQSCRITPSSVIVTKIVNGVETSSREGLTLNVITLRELIAVAATEKLQRVGVHVREEFPGYRISAGHLAGQLGDFELASDGGSIKRRLGPASAKLISLVRHTCP